MNNYKQQYRKLLPIFIRQKRKIIFHGIQTITIKNKHLILGSRGGSYSILHQQSKDTTIINANSTDEEIADYFVDKYISEEDLIDLQKIMIEQI